MLLEGLADLHELGEALGHHGLELADRLRGADAGDDVFALGVDEEFAVELVHAVGGVTGEGDAGAGLVAGVAEHHGLDVDGGAPLGGDVVLAAIDDRAVVHPGREHGTGGAVQLIPRVVREDAAGTFLDEGLEALDELLLVGGGERGVFDVAVVLLVLEFFDDRLERLVVFAFALLHAEDDVAVHLDEAAVAIPSEAGVAGGLGESDDGVVVEAEVEDGVHHARHRIASARADGDEEGHAGGGAELGAHDLLHVLHAGFHLSLEGNRVGALVGVVVGADFGRDREAGRHRETDAGHFGEVSALAAEQGLHRAVAVSFAVAPGVDDLGGLGGFGVVLGFLGHGGGVVGWTAPGSKLRARTEDVKGKRRRTRAREARPDTGPRRGRLRRLGRPGGGLSA